MYLKRLEITGFKSFADKIVLDFAPGFNAVVGPNGCGKSNILDAIRWTLGEQKSSLIRSKNLDQVVFAGTTQRKPAGFVRVSLVLDNSDRVIPGEINPVEITRRGFRDGGGQYFLNSKSARLKDIQESLMDTGIGQGGLFILSSQEIERVLNPQSHERRAMLEETAGINKYQLRKKETLKKLEVVKENVDRLNDILTEVAKQVESSIRQVKKLEKYKKEKIRLSTLEFHLVEQEMEELQKKETLLTEQIHKLEIEKDSLGLEIEKFQRDLNRLKMELDRKNSTYRKVQEERNQTRLDEEKLQGTVGLLEERIRQTQNSLEEYHRELEKMTLRKQETEKRIQEGEEDVVSSGLVLIETDKEIERLKAELLQKEREFEEIRQTIENQERKRVQFREEIKILALQKEHIEKIIPSKEKEIQNFRNRMKKNQEENLQSDEKMESARQQMEELNKTYNQIKEISSEYIRTVEDLTQKFERGQNRARQLKDKLLSSKSELSIMMREEDNFRGFSEAFQKVMKQPGLPPLTPVHSIIQVDAQYETAIDITIGSHFQSLITDTKKDAEICIEYLKRERGGRLTFFPLDMDRSPSSPHPHFPMHTPGVVGWAKDLINTAPLYRDIIDIICGKTLIVEDLNSAYRIYEKQKRDRAFLPRLVTLEGDVLEFSGAVTGGKYKNDRSQLLSRKRKKEQLEKEVSQLSQELSFLLDNMNETKKELDLFTSQKKQKDKEIQQLENQLRNITSQLKVMEKVHSNSGEDLQGMEEQIREKEEILQGDRNRLKELQKQMDSLTSGEKEVIAQINKVQKENAHLINAISFTKNNIEELKEKRGETERNIKLLHSRREQDIEYIHMLSKDREEILERIKEKEESEKMLTSQLQNIRNSLSVFKLKVRSLKIAEESSLEDMKKAEKEFQQLTWDMEQKKKKREEIETSVQELKIKKIERGGRKNYIEDRMKEILLYLDKKPNKTSLDSVQLEKELQESKKRLMDFEGLNFSAQEELEERQKRYDELFEQIKDLQDSSKELRDIIADMDAMSLKELEATLKELNKIFEQLFHKIFGGGNAQVVFSDPLNRLESGIDIMAQPPGKRTTSLNMLSSGEKSLTAVTFLFALMSIKPCPFVILDELDAPLDDSNTEKVGSLIQEFARKTQFIVITHNRKIMEKADTLFGVTMEEPGVSKMISVKLEDFINEKEKTKETV